MAPVAGQMTCSTRCPRTSSSAWSVSCASIASVCSASPNVHDVDFEYEVTDGAPFAVRVDEAKGFGQAARRAVRRAVVRAGEWNVANPDAAPRATGEGAYRVLRVELVV